MSPVIQEAASFLATKNLDKHIYLDRNPEVWQKLVDMGIAAVSTVTSESGAATQVYTFLTTDAAVAAYNQALAPCMAMYAGFNNGWFILPVLAGGLGFLTSWISMKGQPQTGNEQAQSTSKIMMYMMPAMFFICCLQANAAFSIYWVFSSIVSTIITVILNKKFKPASADLEETK